MHISPCIDTLYKNVSLDTALREIKECGYEGYEFWSCSNWDMGEMAELQEELGLQLVNFNSELASLADSRERSLFVANLEKAVAVGKKLKGKRITVLSGDDTGEERAVQHDSIVTGLREVAPMLEEEGVTVVLEASNRRVNRPNNYLTMADEAFDIIREVGSSSVRMLYDIYHQQISEGDLLARMIPNIGKIGHFHAAGVPNRHELHLCEINYDFIFKEIQKTGYPYWIGLEYFPSLPVKEGLMMVAKYL